MTSDSTSKTNSQIVDYLSKEYYGGGKPPFQILTEEEKVFPLRISKQNPDITKRGEIEVFCDLFPFQYWTRVI